MHGPDEDMAAVRSLTRLIDRSEGFTLAFVAINYASHRDALIAEYVAAPGPVIVARLAPAESGIIAQLEAAVRASGATAPRAVFVVGLEAMLEIAGGALPHLENLNLNRSYCARNFPWPVVFWAPEHAVRRFALQAGDFWSCRSGVYHIHGTPLLIEQAFAEMSERLADIIDSPRLEGELMTDLLRELARQEPGQPECDVGALRAAGEALERKLRQYAQDRGLQELERLRDRIRYLQDVVDSRDQASSSELVYLSQRYADLSWRRASYREAELRYKYALQLHRGANSLSGQADCTRGLGWIDLMRAEYAAAASRFSEALALARQAHDPLGEADAIRGLGHLARIGAEHDQAAEHYLQALSLYEDFGDQSERVIAGRVGCLEGLADVAWMRSQYDLAQEFYQQGLDLAGQAAAGSPVLDERGAAGCTEGLGHVEFMRANYDSASEYYERARDLYVALFHKRGEANSTRALAEVARIRDNDDARELFNSALRIYVEIGHRRGAADTIRGLAHLARVQGDYESAIEQYNVALEVYRDIGHRWGQAGSLEGLGDITLARGDYEEAGRRYRDALRLSGEIGDRKGEANITRNLGDLAWIAQHYEAASESYAQARRIAHSIGDHWGEASFIRDQGDAAWKLADYDAARALYEEARAESSQVGDRWGEADAVRKLGNVAWRHGEPAGMAVLYQQALFMYRQVGARRGEAECLAVLNRLYQAGFGMSVAEVRSQAELDAVAEDYLRRASEILTWIGSRERAGQVASGASIDDLIGDEYSEPGKHRPEHRRL